jgi:cyanophycin synthetase
MPVELQSIYVGPNVYLPVPAIRWTFRSPVTRSPQSPASMLAFAAPLFPLLPTLRERLERAAANGGRGLAPADLLMHAAMALQAAARHPAELATIAPAGSGESVDIVCAYKEVDVCLAAMETAVALLTALAARGAQAGPDLFAAMRAFGARIELRCLDQTTRAIVQAAEARGIPWFRLSPAHRIVQLGHGRFSHRLFESTPDSEGLIAGRHIARIKSITNTVLRDVGLPVPRQFAVRDVNGAVEAARRLGYPVVLKPDDSGKGRRVHVGLRGEAAVRRAFENDFSPGDPVVVEQFIAGSDHRMLVVGGRLVAAAKRIPASVVGDGRQSVRELVAEANRDGRRGLRFTNLLVQLVLDDDARQTLREQGLDETAVPPAGRRVFLRRTANISTGGTAEDVTDRVHPDVRRMAELAAQAVGLQVAGIDFITPDIGRSWLEAGAICEVNNTPGLRPHWVAEGGERRDVVTPILDLMFPPDQPHHVPIAAVTGTNGKTTTSHMLARILKQAGKHVGVTSTIGVKIDGQVIAKGDLAGPRGFNMIARNPNVDAIVAEVARGALIRRGVAFQDCDVAVVTNVTTDHLGEFGVTSLEDMARVKEVLAQRATGTLVLNADDPLCLAMAPRARAREVCLVTMAEDCPAATAHVAAGGRCARLAMRGGREVLLLCGPEGELEILPSAALPASLGGLARHNLQNALFAAALAQGLGVALEHIRAALAAFRCDRETVPGRLNVFDGYPFKVILDYGHNPGGYKVIGPLVTALAAGKGRRICVFTSPADRNDAHLVEIAEVAAPYFDFFICRQGLRQNREPGHVPDKLRDALIANGVPDQRVVTSGDPEEAVLAGLGMAEAGDVVYVMSTPNPEGSFWDLIESFGRTADAARKAP